MRTAGKSKKRPLSKKFIGQDDDPVNVYDKDGNPVDPGGRDFHDEGMVGDEWGSAGSGILLTDGLRIMLLLRSRSVETPHTWGIPGGAIPIRGRERMDAKLSATKEVREEIGALPPGRFVDSKVFRKGPFTYTSFVYLVKPEALDKLRPRLNWEHDDWKLVTVEEAQKLRLHPGVKWLLDQPLKGVQHSRHAMLNAVLAAGEDSKARSARTVAEFTGGAAVVWGDDELLLEDAGPGINAHYLHRGSLLEVKRGSGDPEELAKWLTRLATESRAEVKSVKDAINDPETFARALVSIFRATDVQVRIRGVTAVVYGARSVPRATKILFGRRSKTEVLRYFDLIPEEKGMHL